MKLFKSPTSPVCNGCLHERCLFSSAHLQCTQLSIRHTCSGTSCAALTMTRTVRAHSAKTVDMAGRIAPYQTRLTAPSSSSQFVRASSTSKRIDKWRTLSDSTLQIHSTRYQDEFCRTMPCAILRLEQTHAATLGPFKISQHTSSYAIQPIRHRLCAQPASSKTKDPATAKQHLAICQGPSHSDVTRRNSTTKSRLSCIKHRGSDTWQPLNQCAAMLRWSIVCWKHGMRHSRTILPGGRIMVTRCGILAGAQKYEGHWARDEGAGCKLAEEIG